MNADKRQTRVKELLGKLKSGQEITLRDFKSVLGKDEYAEYEAMWANEKDKREVVKPKKILEYEKRLREVKLSHARNEKHRQNYGSSQRSVVLENETQHLTERLIEFCKQFLAMSGINYLNGKETIGQMIKNISIGLLVILVLYFIFK